MSEPVVSGKVREFFHSGSAIRKMFEEGLMLKERYGAGNVADLSIGNPAFGPPEAFREAMRQAAAEPGLHGYMTNAGFGEVREKVAGWLIGNGFFERIDPARIVMTVGAAGAMNVVLKTILNRGDEVIVLKPYFTEYRFYVDNHGGVLRPVDTAPDFGLDIDRIAGAIGAKTRAIIINSPNNPTGRVYGRASLQQLAELLEASHRRYGKWVYALSDEPYREILYDGTPFTSLAALYRNTFLCYSWSKAFNIPGERIGYVAVHPDMEVEDWPLLLGSLAMCNRFLGFVNAPAYMQRVIAASLDATLDTRHYRVKRSRLCAALDEGGYRYEPPEGAFYFFPETPGDEAAFIERAKANLLLVVPGSSFGREGYFRMSYACPEETIDLACRKLIELGRTRT